MSSRVHNPSGTAGFQRLSRRSLRRFTAAAASVAGVEALAACGGTAAATTSSAASAVASSTASTRAAPAATSSAAASTTAASSAVASAASSAAPAASVAKATGTVEYWDWWDPTGQPSTTEYFKQIKSTFEAANSGVTLNLVYPAFGDFETKYLTAAAAGTVPDVMHTSVAWARGFWTKSTIEDISAHIKQTPSVSLDQVVKSALFYNQYRGKVYGLPVEGPDSNVLMYNADMLKSVGIDPSVEAVNKWTWSDFFENATKANKKNGEATSVAGFDGMGGDIYNLSMMGYSDGSSMYNDDQTAVGWNNAQGIETLQVIADINSTKWQGKATWGATEKRPDTKNGHIYDGTVAMQIAGTWNVTQIQDFAPTLDLRIALMPIGPSGKAHGTMSWENMITMPKGAKNADGGWAFGAYYASKDALLIRLAQMKRVGPRKDYFSSQQYQDAEKKTANLLYVPQYGEVGGPYPFVHGTEIHKVASPVLAKGAKGQLSATDAIKQAAALANNAFQTGT